MGGTCVVKKDAIIKRDDERLGIRFGAGLALALIGWLVASPAGAESLARCEYGKTQIASTWARPVWAG
jgi:hypothetical protein